MTHWLLRLHEWGGKRTAWWCARAIAIFQKNNAEPRKLLAHFCAVANDMSGAKRWCDEALQKRQDDPDLLWMRGALCLARNDAMRAAPYFEAVDRLTAAGIVETHAYKQRHLDLARARQGLPYYRRLDDVLVDTAYWSVMSTDGIVYSADVHGKNLANSPFVKGRTTADGHAVIASYPRPTVRIEDECILVGGDENYSHWLFRNLLKLVALDNDGLLHVYPWLVNSDLKSYQKEYFDLLGMGSDQLNKVERGQVIACDKLIVPALLTSQRAIKVGIDWLRTRFKDIMVSQEQAQELLYVSRADALQRHVLNEEHLVQALTALGFTTLVPGHCSVREQIRAFSSARVIVAVHGAGLTNMIYAPDRAQYVEIVSTALDHMDDFRRIANARRQNMTTIVSDRYGTGEEIGPNADYYVDVDAVVRAAKHALSTCA
jgi:capsular polysaccharide biosynthesis protein